MTRAAIVAIGIAAIVILFYIMFSFRQVSNPVRYGVCAVVAMLHDLTIIFGFVAMMGLVAGWEVDALFLTAALTVAGFSLQDTIVVFDRIRENVSRHVRSDFADTVNDSLVDTLARCLNTALTTLFVLLALFLFGGATIHYFVLVLLLGVIIGTYSSVCIAGQLLVVWERREWSALLPWARTRA